MALTKIGIDAISGAIQTSNIQDGAVTSAKIATGGIATVDMEDGSVTSLKIANGGVATADIADGAIKTEKIAAGAVATADLADAAVTTAKIADANVTSGKLATDISITNLAYTGTLTGGTGVINLGSGQVYKDSSGKVGIGTTTMTNRLNVAGAIQSSSTLVAVEVNTVALSQEATYSRLAAFGPNSSTGGTLYLYSISSNGSVQNGAIIDSLGRMTKSSQPAFFAYSNANFAGTSQTPVQFNLVDFNIGSHYNNSTYRFTAPVVGRYLFATMVSFYLNGNARQIQISLRKNGAVHINSDTFTSVVQSNNTHTGAHITTVLELAAGDYVDVDWGLATATVNYYSDNKRIYFSGYLLG
jgi:hypothetical protein